MQHALFLLWMPGGSELLIILVIVLLLFGGSRLPQLAKGLGESVRNFKRGIAEESEEGSEKAKAEEARERAKSV